MAEKKISRRRILATGAALGLGGGTLSGCGEIPLIDNAAVSVRALALGLPDTPIDRETVGKLPYATIRAKIGKGPKVILGLAEKRGQNLYWITYDGLLLVTRGGRLMATVGLPEDLHRTHFFGPDLVEGGLHNLIEPFESTRVLDFGMEGRFSMQVDSVLSPIGETVIRILDLDFETVLVQEENTARAQNWRFKNLFWADKFNGRIWKSRQYVARGMPPLEIELLKPEA